MDLSLLSVLVLIIIAFVSSCAPKAIIIEPIAPAVAKAHAEVKAAAAGAKRVQARVVATHAQSRGIAVAADKMAAETDRLRNLPGVPLNEFDALWKMVTDHQRETFAHEIQARETVEAADEGEQLNLVAEKSTAELEPLAKKTDAAVVELKTEIVKQADDASLGRSLKSVFWMGGILIALLGVLYLVIKLKPGIL